jgi:hypothetical protein
MSVFELTFGEPMPQRKRSVNLHKLLVQVRIWAAGFATTVVFLMWLYHALLHDLSVH